MKILFLIPSKLDGPSARYILDLAEELREIDVDCIITSESPSCHSFNGKRVTNIKIPKIEDPDALNSYFLKIRDLKFDWAYSIGSRVKTDIILLKLKELGIRCAKQFEDDEETIFLNCNKNQDKKNYHHLLEKGINDWNNYKSKNDIINTNYNVIDPYIKGMTLSALDKFSKIWGGLHFDEEIYLAKLDSFSLPPVCSKNVIEALTNIKSVSDRKNNYFIGGSIYSQHDIDIFLSAWQEYRKISPDSTLYISYSRTSRIVINYLIDNHHNKNGIRIVDLNTEEKYQYVLMKCKFIISIGGGQFDEKRLPSRLVKSLFLGKNIILPSVGFGDSLSNNKNAFVCRSNCKEDWLDALTSSFYMKDDVSIGKNAIQFAKSHFDIQVVAKTVKEKLTQDRLVLLNKEELEYCMMSDHINLRASDKKGLQLSRIDKIRYRLVLAGNKLFLQTLNRDDYSFQVTCSASANSADTLYDNGFSTLNRYNRITIFDIDLDINIPPHDVSKILKSFRGSFQDLSPQSRNRIFNKYLLSFRLYKILEKLIHILDIKLVFFHADMQSVEAVVSNLLNKSLKEVNTVSLQHALFYSTEDKSDVNIVNTAVSPSLYGFVWNQYVHKLILNKNPHKKLLITQPIPPFRLKNLDTDKLHDLLIILDGPNHNFYNNEMLKVCYELVESGVLENLYVKLHPYHPSDPPCDIITYKEVQLVSEIDCMYRHVVFYTSTLGYELSDNNFSVYQFSPQGSPKLTTIMKSDKIQQFSSASFLADKISSSNNNIYNQIFEFSNVLESYQRSFSESVEKISL